MEKHLYVFAALVLPVFAGAQQPGCIELSTQAQTEIVETAADGTQSRRLVDVATVVPGTEVVWSVRAKNVCEQPAGGVVIDSPVPAQMRYVPASASAGEFEVRYSLDGTRYSRPEELQVREADGSLRPARPDEYRHVRYALRTALAPGEAVTAQYRTVVR